MGPAPASNRPTTRERWVSPALLLVFADLSGTFAQFMPMKVVLVLATGSIPSFFPGLLVEGGAVLTSFALILATGLLGLASRVSRDLSVKISRPPKPLHGKATSVTRIVHHEGKKSLSFRERKLFAVLLVFILAAGSLFASPIFAVMVFAWIGGSILVLQVSAHRNPRIAPFSSPEGEFAHRLEQWLKQSALWSVVGGAILTLLTFPPATGLTGILLGVVLLRRLQQVFPEFVEVARKRLSSESHGRLVARETSALLHAPYDFFGSPQGSKALADSLESRGLQSDAWHLVGKASRAQLSLLTREKRGGGVVLCRVFSPKHSKARDHEFELRSHWGSPTIFHHESVSSENIAGFPSIIVKYPEQMGSQGEATEAAIAATDWQTAWEVMCIQSDSAQANLREHGVEDPKDFLLPHLLLAAQIRGPHQKSIERLISEFGRLREAYLAGPRVVTFGGPLKQEDLVEVGDGVFEPIDLSSWDVGFFGESWGSLGESRIQELTKVSPTDKWKETIGTANLRRLMRATENALETKRPLLSIDLTAQILQQLSGHEPATHN